MIAPFKIFGKEIGIYGIMALIGIFAYGFYITKMAKKRKLDPDTLINISLVAAIGVFLGSHLLYGVTNIDNLINGLGKITNFKGLITLLYYTFGGAVFYGGLLGGILAGYIYLKRKKFDTKIYSDIIAPGIPLFHFFGRIGCFLGGCCFGFESKIGFVYHHSLIAEANNVKRFPVQLVESACNMLLFLVLNRFLKNKKYEGKLIYIYLFSYAIIRFLLEFLRGDTYRGFFLGLSTSQIISILIIITVLTIWLIKNRKKKA